MKLTDSNVIQIDQFRCVGVRPPQILEVFACSSGGYDKIHYRKKDIHNQIGWQRREHIFDASTILNGCKQVPFEVAEGYFWSRSTGIPTPNNASTQQTMAHLSFCNLLHSIKTP
ncbi:hypothetical protein JHK84_044518 [Glycine max]|nr:hypothetical protein JHK86_044408 [Glycine max]KAG5107611.1 hypothetical protein JHK84_044518 [Glycine max]